jgi:hypothetical protein
MMNIVIGIICCIVFGIAMMRHLEVLKLQDHIITLEKTIEWYKEDLDNLKRQLDSTKKRL